MSTVTFPGSSAHRWKHQRSDWHQSTHDALTLKEKVSELMRQSIKRIGEFFLISVMLISNVLGGLTLLIGLPVAAVIALSSLVIVISGAIAILGTALEFLGLA